MTGIEKKLPDKSPENWADIYYANWTEITRLRKNNADLAIKLGETQNELTRLKEELTAFKESHEELHSKFHDCVNELTRLKEGK